MFTRKHNITTLTFVFALTLFVLGSGVQQEAAADPVSLWLQADKITGVANGGTVNNWSDQSLNGNNAAKSNGSPTYHTGVLNGNPVVRFDNNNPGSHDEFQIPDHSTLDLNEFSIFLVGKAALGEYDAMLVKGGLDFGPGPHNWNYLVASNTSVMQLAVSHSEVAPLGNIDRLKNTDITGTFGIVGWTFNLNGVATAADSNAYHNGVLDNGGIGQSGTRTDFTNSSPVFIGGGGFPDPVEGGTAFTGDIAEIFILPYEATGQQILDLNAYLGDKYAISVAQGGDPAAGLVLLGGVIIPEPSTFALAAFGLLSLGSLARRRRRRA